jgi:hypothetical protein
LQTKVSFCVHGYFRARRLVGQRGGGDHRNPVQRRAVRHEELVVEDVVQIPFGCIHVDHPCHQRD